MTGRLRNCCFTLFDFGDDWKLTMKDISDVDKCKYICGQLEEGKETGRAHIQGYIELSEGTSLRTLKKKVFKNDSVHIEKRRGTQDEAIKYCMKDDSRIDDFVEYGVRGKQGKRSDIEKVMGMIEDGIDMNEISSECPSEWVKYYKAFEKKARMLKVNDEKKKNAEKYIDAELNNWQTQAVSLLLDQNNRKILFIVDFDGNVGKTWLSYWLECNLDAFVTEHGSVADISYNWNCEEIVCFDYSRSYCDRVNYGLLESFKNGRVFSGKYESCNKYKNDVKIIVMLNEMPDFSKLSIDRYEICRIVDGHCELFDGKLAKTIDFDDEV